MGAVLIELSDAVEIRHAYGEIDVTDGRSRSVERYWIRWQILYWTGVTAASPAPLLLGQFLA